VAFQKSVKPADVGAPNRLLKRANLGNPRRLLANTVHPFVQPLDDQDSFGPRGDAAIRVLSRLEEGRR